MWLSSAKAMIGGQPAYQFCGYVHHCRDCPMKAQCLRRSDQKRPRSVAFFYQKVADQQRPDVLQIMKDKIDSPAGDGVIRAHSAGTPQGQWTMAAYVRTSQPEEDSRVWWRKAATENAEDTGAWMTGMRGYFRLRSHPCSVND